MELTDKAKAGGSRDMGYIERDSSFAWIELLKAAHILLVGISEGQQAHYAILLLRSCIFDVQALVQILDWIVQNCHATRPQMMLMPQSFSA